MRSPRIVARPWRSLHTHSRSPLRSPSEPPRVRPSWSAPIPWRDGARVPPRRPSAGSHELARADVTLDKKARIPWSSGSAVPRRVRPAPHFEASPPADRTRGVRPTRKPPFTDLPRAQFLEDEAGLGPYDHERAVRMLESRGPTYVHERFEALVARHCHPGGSAGTVTAALREMLQIGLKPRPAFYGAALAAITVHPNFLLRAMLLDLMRQNWIETTPEHRIHIALGLLRDGQYEMAVDEVEDMLAEGISVPPYLHEILIFALANLGFLDEAMTHLNYRTQQDPPLRDDILYFLLDTCAAAQHYSSTTHLWRTVGDKITPSDGTLLNVLNTAARYADPPLALEALRRLSDRKMQMSFHHFEPVVEAYVGVGDLEGALRMLCVMNDAGIRPRRDATRGLFSTLKERPGEIAGCRAILEQLRETCRVPIAAVNVLLEAAIEVGDVSTAENILSRMHNLTPDNPTQTTYLPFLTLPVPPPPVCAEAITLFPYALNLPAPDLARLAVYLAPYNIDAALGYLRRVDAVHEGETDAWEVHANAVRAVAAQLVQEDDERMWEFLKEVARRSPAVAKQVQEMGRTEEL